jgi:hypothetical protein
MIWSSLKLPAWVFSATALSREISFVNNVQRYVWFHGITLILAALLTATVATAIAHPPMCDVGAGEDVGCARGFETRERDGYGSFRWTDGDARVTLIASGYGAPGIVEIVMAAPRPPETLSPSVTLAVATTSVTGTPSDTPRRYLLLLRPDPLSGDAFHITIQSDTWKPPNDRRNLGVLIYHAGVAFSRSLALPSVQHILALLAIGLSVSLVGRNRMSLMGRTAVALTVIGGCGVLWVWLPTRTVPFLPFYAVLLGGVALLFAWLERRELRQLATTDLRPALLAASGGVALDALLVAGVARGEWSVAVIAAQAACVVWGMWHSIGRTLTLSGVLQIALGVRLAALTTRLLSGEIGSDPDVELFYNYGRATLELGLPVVEYPSGALIPWAILALPASRELFALALPLCNTVADLVIVLAIWSMSERRSSASGNTGLACFYALSPLLLPFWHGKYDPLPTAFLVLGLMAYTYGRMAWSGAALGIGGALKWTPWLAAATLALGMLRARSLRAPASLWAFAAGGMMAVAATSIPFALIDWDRFLAPYTLQGGRAITGESVWFLAVLITAPEYWARLPAPWGSVETGGTMMGIAIGVQGIVLASLILSALRFPSSAWRPAALAALAPAAFLLLNRVFSPQYLVTITAALLIACAIVGHSPRHTRGIVGLLTIAQASNLLIWPNTVPWWPLSSAVMFTAALAALAWLTVMTVRKERAAD